MRTPHAVSRQHSQTFAKHHNNNFIMDGSTMINPSSVSMFEKRNKIDRTFAFPDLSSGYDSFDFMSYPLPQTADAYSPSPLPPHINLQRPSEPASPVTIASTLSHTSSPSPGPSTRNPPTSEPISAHDFLLFDDSSLHHGSNLYPQKRFQGGHRRFGSGSSLASDAGSSSHTSNPVGQYGNAVFPVIAQPDSFSSSSFGNNYMMQSHLGNEQMGLFDVAKQTPKSAPRQMLQPPITFGQNAMAVAQAFMQHHGQSDDEDTVPGLSPASRPSGFVPTSSRPSISSDGFRSPKSPRRTPDHSHDISTQPTARLYSQTNQLSPHTPNTSHMNDVHGMISDFPNLFQKAQREHSIAQVSPGKDISRERSPFQVSSPYHQDLTMVFPSHISTAHDQRIKQEREFAAAEVLRQQMESEAARATTPKTISPKDALLEYHEQESHHDSSKFFETAHTDRSSMANLGDLYQHPQFYQTHGDNETEASFGSMATSRRESSSTSLNRTPSNTMPYTQLSQLSAPQYTYSRTALQNMTQRHNPEVYAPVQQETSFNSPAKSTKPAAAKANSGTYTCTTERCGQRFTTAGKLQKHRRESHRHGTPGDAIGSAMSPAAVAARNAQPGPHKCSRVNPSTGKLCSIVFSRPYDLTRHEDTIHNGGKEKVRCEICTDEKTFSRYDALVRHKRVKHGIVDRH